MNKRWQGDICEPHASRILLAVRLLYLIPKLSGWQSQPRQAGSLNVASKPRWPTQPLCSAASLSVDEEASDFSSRSIFTKHDVFLASHSHESLRKAADSVGNALVCWKEAEDDSQVHTLSRFHQIFRQEGMEAGASSDSYFPLWLSGSSFSASLRLLSLDQEKDKGVKV